jgi:hypothetical protein
MSVSNTKKTYIECFNTKLLEFLDDLVASLPHFKEKISPLKKAVNAAINIIDYKLPQKVFAQHVSEEYENNILNRDEAFLLNDNYENLQNVDGVSIDIIDMVKQMWKNLQETDKQAVWSHLELLVRLNRKCNSC